MKSAEDLSVENTGQPLAIMVHGLHKCGTMFLYQLFFRLCRDRGIRYFSANHPQPNDHMVNADIDFDFCLGPIRTFEEDQIRLNPQFRVKRVFQIRDPRDILISQFHSLGWRHTDAGFSPVQKQSRTAIRRMSIDEYVLDEKLATGPLLARYRRLLQREIGVDDRLVRYEQMVTDFPAWLRQVIPLFEFGRSAWIFRKYVLKYRNEFQPEDRPNAHKRRVIPGDFRRSLKRRTVAQLNELLQPVLSGLDYPLT
jgi:hypothetical protein